MRVTNFSERRVGNIAVLGAPYAFVYLVEDILIDTGTAFWGYKISSFLKDNDINIKAILLTHSHYDHIGGIPYILKDFKPQIFAHPYMRRVMSSENAIKLINDMNSKEMVLLGFKNNEYRFKPFEFQEVENGWIMKLKNHRITCYYTPGHTRDSVAYFIEPEKMLIPGEAAGVPNHKNTFILPQFLSSVKDYEESLRFISSLEIETLGLPHEMIIEGKENVKNYLKNSIETTLWYVEYLKGLILRFGDEYEGIKNRVVEDIYKKNELKQPFHAFFTNLSAQIGAIKKELM